MATCRDEISFVNDEALVMYSSYKSTPIQLQADPNRSDVMLKRPET